MRLRVRCATDLDVPAMHQVRKSMRENRLSDQTRITEASYLPYIVAGSIWVAEINDCIAGFAAIDAAGSSVWALFVDPEFEGAGVGRALHTEMLAWAQHARLKPLTLTTEPSSRAVQFYSQAGWTRRGVTAEGEVIFERNVLS